MLPLATGQTRQLKRLRYKVGMFIPHTSCLSCELEGVGRGRCFVLYRLLNCKFNLWQNLSFVLMHCVFNTVSFMLNYSSVYICTVYPYKGHRYLFVLFSCSQTICSNLSVCTVGVQGRGCATRIRVSCFSNWTAPTR